MESCEHLDRLPDARPAARTQGCEECLASGGRWAHFKQTHHEVMQSFEPGATWGWCYEHERQLGPLPAAR